MSHPLYMSLFTSSSRRQALSRSPRSLPALLTLVTLCLVGLSSLAHSQDRFTHDEFLKAFPKPSAEQLDAAKELYTARCANCHGAQADGKGVLSSKISPRPRNMRSKAWFESLDYEARIKRLRRVIIGGGPAVGGSALMPPNPDLRTKRELLYALIYLIALPHKPSPILEAPKTETATE